MAHEVDKRLRDLYVELTTIMVVDNWESEVFDIYKKPFMRIKCYIETLRKRLSEWRTGDIIGYRVHVEEAVTGGKKRWFDIGLSESIDADKLRKRVKEMSDGTHT